MQIINSQSLVLFIIHLYIQQILVSCYEGYNQCQHNNGGCEQLCVNQWNGHKCGCNKGYRLKGNTSCEDVDECQLYKPCSHQCINTFGGYYCECDPGQTLNFDLHRCQMTNVTPELLIASNSGKILNLNLESKDIRTIKENLNKLYRLDYIFDNNTIFWVDRKTINKETSTEKNNSTEVLLSNRLIFIDSFAVDWIHNNIYWHDSIKNTFDVMNLETKIKKTLFKDIISNQLAIDPLEGWLFYSNCGSYMKNIKRVGLDWSERKTIINDHAKNALTLDLQLKRIFWIGRDNNNIQSADYNGGNIEVVFRTSTEILYFDVFQNWIYYLKYDNSIHKIEKFSEIGSDAILLGDKNITTIRVFHPDKQPKGLNYCEGLKKKCSHLCLGAPRLNPSSKRFTCACPQNLVLSSDLRTCIPDEIKLYRANIESTAQIYPIISQIDISKVLKQSEDANKLWDQIDHYKNIGKESNWALNDFKPESFTINPQIYTYTSYSSSHIAIVIVAVVKLVVICIVIYRRCNKKKVSTDTRFLISSRPEEDQPEGATNQSPIKLENV